MYSRVQAALTASGLLQKYEKQFQENALEDSIVDECLKDKESMSFLVDVMPPAGHRLQFLKEYRKLSEPSLSSSSAQELDIKPNVKSEAHANSEIIDISDDDDDDSEKTSTLNKENSSGGSSSKSSQVPRREFKILAQEAHDAAVKEYVNKIEHFISDLGVSYDSPNLQSVHEEYKADALTTFTSSYKQHRTSAFEIVKIKREDGSQEDVEVKMEAEGEEVDRDLSLKQNELLEAIDKHFKSLQEKNEFEILKAHKIKSEAEKLYINQMTKFLDTCLNESDLLAKEVDIKQEVIDYFSGNVPASVSNSQLTQQLNNELNDFISNWFKSHLELFQLQREEDDIVVREALMTAKIYYNDEMEKHFQSNIYLKPSTLAQLDEQISSTAMKNTLKQHKDLKMTPGQQAQLKDAMKIVFKKYEEKNLLRMPTKSPAIGIDLGTTYSCVAVVIHGKVEVIRNENGNNTTPSFVSFKDDGSVVSGDAAKDQSYRNPQNTIFDSKRLIGRKLSDPEVQKSMKSWPFEVVDEEGKPKIKITNSNADLGGNRASKRIKLSEANVSSTNASLILGNSSIRDGDATGSTAGKTYHPEEISAHVLKKMKQIAEDYLGTKVESAVVTVPALFNDSQRQATKDAAEIAGLKVLRIINEPTAAAIAYRLNRMDDLKRNVLVFDLGGGTLDVAVLKITGGEIEVKAVHGDTHLGGEDFDGEMIQKCIDVFRGIHNLNLARGRESKVDKERFDVSCRLRRIRNECERQKRVLSSTDKTVVGLDVIDSSYANLDLHVPFTREMFESINQQYFDKCIEIVGKVLEEAKMTKTDINDIVLVGGSTRIPKIQKMLSEFFEGKALTKTINPDEAVAVGAAIQACILNGEQVSGFENSVLKLNDVTPFSIGIEDSKGNFVVQIPKNSKIPCEYTKIWEPVYDFQTAITFRVYEGEHSIAVHNNLLGKFTLNGIPANKERKEKVKVTSCINDEGILSVQAKCKSNKVTNNIKITAYKDRLTRKEIEEAKEK